METRDHLLARVRVVLYPVNNLCPLCPFKSWEILKPCYRIHPIASYRLTCFVSVDQEDMSRITMYTMMYISVRIDWRKKFL